MVENTSPGLPISLRVAVVSANRPGNVAAMQTLCDLPLVWYVPTHQQDAYRAAGAHHLQAVPGPLPNVSRARNQAIDDACNDDVAYLALVDDDMKYWRWVTWYEGTKAKTEKVGLSFVLGHVFERLRDTPFHLGGVAPTQNWLYVCGGPRVKTSANVCGATILLKLPTPVRYDSETDSIEDLDFAMQHVARHGGLVRDDLILMDHDMRGAEGGYQSVDREALDLAAEHTLFAKWPRYVKPPRKNGKYLRIDWKLLQADAQHELGWQPE